MNILFTKLNKKTHAPVIGCMAAWQRCSRIFGVVGTND